MSPIFDIVIPVHKKDLEILEYCIKAAKEKLNPRRIIVISKEKYTQNAEWFCESKFPFSMKNVEKYIGKASGWYFQQLLKMYCVFVVPDIAQNVMILDSDTVFFKKTKMFNKHNQPFYNLSKDKKISQKDFDIKVDNHIKKLLPEISRDKLPQEFQKYSGVCHNMIFNRDIMAELFAKIEKKDKDGDKFYDIFLKHAGKGNCVSEYQIYFNYLAVFHGHKIAMRKLKYKNTADINIKKYQRDPRYHYCSFHSYLRGNKKTGIKAKIKNFFGNLYANLFQIRQYNIGIAKCNIAQFLTLPNQEITWLKPPKITEFRADPFAISKQNIIFEKYNRFTRKGEIATLNLNENFEISQEKTILQNNTHFSYPYIFENEGKKYALIENHQASELALYELKNDQKIEKIHVIFKNLKVIDPSIIKHDAKFWIFFSTQENPMQDLYIAYSDDLFGEFKMHKNNPVKSDITNSRNGGEIFLHQGNFYRPAQNCLQYYGKSLNLNKITKLTPDEFMEIQEIEIHPNQLGKYPKSLHHIAKMGEELTLIDGQKNIFAIYKPILYLWIFLRRVFK